MTVTANNTKKLSEAHSMELKLARQRIKQFKEEEREQAARLKANLERAIAEAGLGSNNPKESLRQFRRLDRRSQNDRDKALLRKHGEA